MDTAAEKVCRRVLSRWQGDADDDLESDRSAEDFAEGLGLDLDALSAEADRVAGDILQKPPEAFFAELVREKASSRALKPAKGKHPLPGDLREAVEPVLDELVRPPGSGNETAPPVGSLEKGIEQSLKEAASQRAATISEWLLRQAEQAHAGTAGARRSGRRLVERLRSLETDSRAMLANIRQDLAQIEPHFADKAKPASKRQEPEAEALVCRYCLLRLSLAVYQQLGKSLRFTCQQVVAVEDRLAELGRRLGAFAERFSDPPLVEEPTGREDAYDNAPSETARLAARLDAMASAVDRQIRDDVLAENNGLMGLLDERGDLAEIVAAELRRAARSAVIRTIREIRAAASGGNPAGESEAAIPALSASGGARRLLVVASHDELARLQPDGSESSAPAASTLVDTETDATVCCEMERLSIRRAAAELIDRRADYADLASRLHTRIDVQWPRLM